MIVNKTGFLSICQELLKEKHNRFNIGTYKESMLHLVLKNYYCADNSFHEVKSGKFISDIRIENKVTEIQTSSFYLLKKKLDYYFDNNIEVKVVFPVIVNKYVYWMNQETGEISKKVLSPKHQRASSAFRELYSISNYFTNDLLSIDIVFINADCYKLLDGIDKTKKKHSTKIDVYPTELIDIITINSSKELELLFTYPLNEQFTIKEFGKTNKLTYADSCKACNFLEKMNVISLSKIENRYKIYKKAGSI